MTNEELLQHNGPSATLTAIENQERLLMRRAARAKPDPNCAKPVNQFRTAGLTPNEYTFDSHEPTYRWQRQLRYVLPLIDGWQWILVPVRLDLLEESAQ